MNGLGTRLVNGLSDVIAWVFVTLKWDVLDRGGKWARLTGDDE